MDCLDRREFLSRAGKGALGAWCVWRALHPGMVWAGDAAGRKPNIVLILADDLGWSDLACYGNRFHETPNLDRLASDGMRFTDAYAAAPVCSPTRAALLTGKYPARLGLTAIIERGPNATARWREPAITPYVSLDEITPFEALKPEGYSNAHVGKWHVGGVGDRIAEGDATKQGADSTIANPGQPPDYFYPYRRTLEDGRTLELGRPPAGREGDYLPERMTDEALAFLSRHRDGPFFLFMAHYLPHTSTGDRLQARSEKIAKYQAKAGLSQPDEKMIYAAMIEHLDDSVGALVRKLDALGIADNTLVIFASDNGGHGGKTSNLPLRGAKGELYEGGIRVPLIARWPGRVRPGSVSTQPVVTCDLYSTILDAGGARLAPGQVVDGETLVPVLTRGASLRRKAIFWHYPHFTPAASSAVREGDWKLIELLDDRGMRTELYNLAADPGERHDLASQEPRRVRALRSRLEQWRRSVGARMPVAVAEDGGDGKRGTDTR